MVKGKGHGRIDTRWEEVPGVVFEFLLKALGELFLSMLSAFWETRVSRSSCPGFGRFFSSPLYAKVITPSFCIPHMQIPDVLAAE